MVTAGESPALRTLDRGTRVKRLTLGDEFHVRYVPQSRYFQRQELEVSGTRLSGEQTAKLNQGGTITLERRVL